MDTLTPFLICLASWPGTTDMNLSRIPDDLKQAPQWVLWRYVARDGGELTKVPFQPDGEFAKSNDPTTWSTFETVAGYAAEDLQPGFVFSAEGPFCGIDLDGCRDPETKVYAEWAREIIKQLDSYSELSPSGTGVKVFVRASLNGKSGKKKELDFPKCSTKTPGIEIYDHGRYFAVTGKKLAGVATGVNERQAIVDQLIAKFWPEAPRATGGQVFGPTSSVMDRCRKYVERLPSAISGQGGHNALFHVACVAVLGFGLDDHQAYGVLDEYNRRCEPPWTERELLHKINQAHHQPGQRNYLRDSVQAQWNSIQVPKYVAPVEIPVKAVTTMRKSVEAFLDSIKEGREHLTETGIADLDYAIGGGIADGEMVIMAARPSHGKSAIALQLMHYWTLHERKCLFISEEMSALSLGKRAVQAFSQLAECVWHSQIDDVRAESQAHFDRRAECYIVEGCRTIAATVKEIERHVEEFGVKCVALDYAGLLNAPGKTRYEQITNVSIALRQTATKMKIILIVLCQLNREMCSRESFVPKLSDIRDTGQLEQDADVILFNVWPFKIDPSKPENEYKFYVAKNRNREIKKHVVDCTFDGARQTILSLDSDVPETQYEFPTFDRF